MSKSFAERNRRLLYRVAAACAVAAAFALAGCEQKSDSTAQQTGATASKPAVDDVAIATMLTNALQWTQAGEVYQKAMAADPDNAKLLDGYRTLVADAGYLGVAMRSAEEAVAAAPAIAAYNIHRAEVMLLTSGPDGAIPILEGVPASDDNYVRNTDLARAYAGAGRFAEAADTLLAIQTEKVSRDTIETAAQVLRSAPTPASEPDKLPVIEGPLSFVYGYVGAKERALASIDRGIDSSGGEALYWIWDPLYGPLRKTDQFKAILTKAGLADYWRIKAWPDLCHPLGAADFVCD